MKTIGIITCEKYPDLHPSDQPMAEMLRARGLTVTPLVWSSAEINWFDYDLLLMRSAWDYVEKLSHFHQWLNFLQLHNRPVANHIFTIRGNMHKFYLRELKRKGMPVIPTLWLPYQEQVSLRELLEQKQWSKAVIKPAVSAGAYKTYVVSLDQVEKGQQLLDELLADQDVLLQVFLEEIHTQGELSLIFFSGVFSHAVRKQAKAGDFRVQPIHGGTATAITPPDYVIKSAKQVVEHYENPLYARIDGVEAGGEFLLMEAELIEPDLFWDYHPQARENFINAFAKKYAPKKVYED